ncbi:MULTISPECIES: winged helix-turn-helix domain-containing protein [Enterobacter]|uniref:winged helix-turn-helix domain-containing protein n=1 Tax=Enterobacter TaxID=547 RepID=UPI0018721D48|nr:MULTISPECIES: winged helix-turn-helix domain-containing protein [Enterobacter]MBE4832801.1 winged helix-turn-helix domain-containing protein [Enterobacter cloacae complex sp. P47BA]WMU74478.1 winged helix-turn-helix domain-containing protein [Enterobacter bugandensis]HDS9727822.1 winged helix-turn-helix domain-containing protein [Enterobacter bugandensis]
MKRLGYLLGSDSEGVFFMKEQSLLIPLNIVSKPVRLRRTMFHLLDFILEKANTGLIPDDEIMRNVWEGYGLKASTPRLWQVMNELKKKLTNLGVEPNFITRVEGKGYIANRAIMEPVYIRASFIWQSSMVSDNKKSLLLKSSIN